MWPSLPTTLEYGTDEESKIMAVVYITDVAVAMTPTEWVFALNDVYGVDKFEVDECTESMDVLVAENKYCEIIGIYYRIDREGVVYTPERH